MIVFELKEWKDYGELHNHLSRLVAIGAYGSVEEAAVAGDGDAIEYWARSIIRGESREFNNFISKVLHAKSDDREARAIPALGEYLPTIVLRQAERGIKSFASLHMPIAAAVRFGPEDAAKEVLSKVVIPRIADPKESAPGDLADILVGTLRRDDGGEVTQWAADNIRYADIQREKEIKRVMLRSIRNIPYIGSMWPSGKGYSRGGCQILHTFFRKPCERVTEGTGKVPAACRPSSFQEIAFEYGGDLTLLALVASASSESLREAFLRPLLQTRFTEGGVGSYTKEAPDDRWEAKRRGGSTGRTKRGKVAATAGICWGMFPSREKVAAYIQRVDGVRVAKKEKYNRRSGRTTVTEKTLAPLMTQDQVQASIALDLGFADPSLRIRGMVANSISERAKEICEAVAGTTVQALVTSGRNL